jgi:hypothetical protein
MNWTLVLWAGIKTFLYVAVAMVIEILVTASTGYKPEGIAQTFIWTYLLLPGLSGIIGALKNWYQHKDDKPVT